MVAKDLGFDQGCYERALALSELRYDDSADDEAFDFVLGQIDECVRLVGEYVEGNGYRSEVVRGVIREWGAGFVAELGVLRQKLEAGRRIVSDGRAVMRQARDVFNERVSAELLTGGERFWRGALDGVSFAALFVVPVGGVLGLVGSEGYFSSLETERNRQREEFCQGLLDQVNDKLTQASKDLKTVTDRKDGIMPSSPGGGSGSVGGGWSGVSGAGGGWSGVGGAGGGLDVGALLERAGSVDGLAPGGGWESEGGGAPGGSGGRELVGVSDLDGVGLVGRPVNQTVTPNGLVGGYVPPSVVDAGDPRWDAGYRIPSSVVGVSRAASAGAIGVVGGVSARSLLSSSLAGGGRGVAGGSGGGRAVPGGRGGPGGGVPVAGGGAPGTAGSGEREKEGFKKRRGARGLYFDPPESEEEWDPGHGPGSVDDGVEFELDLDEWGLS
ncbi:hypothetical protein EHS14_04100 [Schaalia georgiae]|nr:hypothetical protein EHS14_04100 [Schaalia georgiae]